MKKRSKQRDEIIEILSEKNYHPTSEEIYLELKKKLPGVGIATVYRNLEQLTRDGKIVKIDIPDGAARYDGNTVRHYHIRCTSCGDVKDVWMDLDLLSHLETEKFAPGFEIRDYSINLWGICKNCREKNKEDMNEH